MRSACLIKPYPMATVRLEATQVRDMLGTIDGEELSALLTDIIERDAASMFTRINNMAELAPDYDAMLAQLLSILHDIAVAQVLPDGSDQIDETSRAFARRLDKEDVQLYYQLALNGRRDLHIAPDPKTAFEMTMIRLLAFCPWEPADTKTTRKDESVIKRSSPSAEGKLSTVSYDGPAEDNNRPDADHPGSTGTVKSNQDQVQDTPVLAGNDDWHNLIGSMALDGLTKETGLPLHIAGI